MTEPFDKYRYLLARAGTHYQSQYADNFATAVRRGLALQKRHNQQNTGTTTHDMPAALVLHGSNHVYRHSVGGNRRQWLPLVEFDSKGKAIKVADTVEREIAKAEEKIVEAEQVRDRWLEFQCGLKDLTARG